VKVHAQYYLLNIMKRYKNQIKEKETKIKKTQKIKTKKF